MRKLLSFVWSAIIAANVFGQCPPPDTNISFSGSITLPINGRYYNTITQDDTLLISSDNINSDIGGWGSIFIDADGIHPLLFSDITLTGIFSGAILSPGVYEGVANYSPLGMTLDFPTANIVFPTAPIPTLDTIPETPNAYIDSIRNEFPDFYLWAYSLEVVLEDGIIHSSNEFYGTPPPEYDTTHISVTQNGVEFFRHDSLDYVANDDLDFSIGGVFKSTSSNSFENFIVLTRSAPSERLGFIANNGFRMQVKHADGYNEKHFLITKDQLYHSFFATCNGSVLIVWVDGTKVLETTLPISGGFSFGPGSFRAGKTLDNGGMPNGLYRAIIGGPGVQEMDGSRLATLLNGLK